MSESPRQWLVLRKRDTDPWEVYAFVDYDEAALFWDATQAQWSTVFFCRVAAQEGQPLDITPVISGFKARVDAAERQATEFRAALQALADRHDWSPGLGRCICAQHLHARDLLDTKGTDNASHPG